MRALRKTIQALLIWSCACLPAFAGTWGNSYWGTMHWGNTTLGESAPTVAPTIVSVNSSPDALVVQFNFNGSNGQDGWSVVDTFEVVCVNVNDAQDIESASGSGAPITVNDVGPGDTYSCTVKAMNQLGDSPESLALNGVPEEALQQSNLIILLHVALCKKDPGRPGCPK